MNTALRVRTAVTGDADEIARIHVNSWRQDYRMIIDAAYLDQLSCITCARKWVKRIAGEGCVLVAGDEKGLAGFVFGSAERTPDSPFAAELRAIYVAPDMRGLGVGRLLVRTFFQWCCEQDLRSVLVWVFRGNPARGFYEHLGAETFFEKTVSIGGRDVPEIGYGWLDCGVFFRVLKYCEQDSAISFS